MPASIPAMELSQPNIWSHATTLGDKCLRREAVSVHRRTSIVRQRIADSLTGGWLERLKTIIPTYGTDLKRDAAATRETRARTASVLRIEQQPRAATPSPKPAAARA
jgi:hypothetical protein